MRAPASIRRASKSFIEQSGDAIREGSLCMLDDMGARGHLYIFGPPVEIQSVYDDSFRFGPRGEKNFEYRIGKKDPAPSDSAGPRDGYSSLWAAFREELVMLRLNGGRYEIGCGDAAITSWGADYGEPLIFSPGDDRELARGLEFLARKTISLMGFRDIREPELKKLVDFMVEDYRTGKYSRKSHRIAMDADSVFFPSPRNDSAEEPIQP